MFNVVLYPPKIAVAPSQSTTLKSQDPNYVFGSVYKININNTQQQVGDLVMIPVTKSQLITESDNQSASYYIVDEKEIGLKDTTTPPP